jgi:predicted ABC-type ATPase
VKKPSFKAPILQIIPEFDRRPLVIVIAGPNGAGKSTFYETHLKNTGLRFLNADVLAGEMKMDAYQAAEIAAKLRNEFVKQGESFIFETVFSDPAGDKLNFLNQTIAQGYTAIVCFIGIAGVDRSEERVLMRVSQGGHDVPSEKLSARFPRTMANLKRAIQELPHILIFDNDDLATPYRLVAVYQGGRSIFQSDVHPAWLKT